MIPQKYIYDLWSFFADQLSAELWEHLDSLGMLTIVGNDYYRLLLLDPKGPAYSENLTRELRDAASCGLNGLAIKSDSGKLQIISIPKD